MNRPIPTEKVREDNFCIDTLNYMEDLDMYCSELEHKLDKAIELLETYVSCRFCPNNSDDCGGLLNCKENWRKRVYEEIEDET